MHLHLHPLGLVLLALLIQASIQLVTSHPIRTRQWTKTGQFLDAQRRGIWEVFEKEGGGGRGSGSFLTGPPGSVPSQLVQRPNRPDTLNTDILLREPLHILNGNPNRPYKRLSSPSGKSIVSVLIPIAPTVLPESAHRHYSHHLQELKNQQEKQTSLPPAGATAHKSSLYAEIPSGSRVGIKEEPILEDDDCRSSSASPSPPPPESSSSSFAHTIPFFSYRIGHLFLHLKPAAFPLHPLPGTFTTVMILLAMVWIAIFTIGLVELGNYIWKKRRAARLAAGAVDEDSIPRISGRSTRMVKVPGRVGVVPGETAKWRFEPVDECEDVDASSGSELDVDDHHIV